MTKGELIARLSGILNQPEGVIAPVVNGMLEAILRELVKGNSVRLLGFGTFEVKERSPRKGRNPRTGEAINIPAHKTPQFRAGKRLKEAVRNED